LWQVHSNRDVRDEEEFMTVKAILNEKGRNVLTSGPQLTVREAAKILHDNHIGALVVVDHLDHIVGILAERDVVAAIATQDNAGLDKPISTIMWTNVYRCSEEMTAGQVMAMMSDHRARHIPVETNGRLAGIISIGDVVKAQIRQMEREAEHIKAYIAG